ncbi:spermine oxidase-like isoform X1 [Tribolium castaneum]|uniref:spermine oxidase-like isoform X1 n=1 Tax=Tribolium castaneum TaxID=7070 RepID=UPI0030FE4988
MLFVWLVLIIFHCVEGVSVIVVGAGASGIAATAKLLDNNVTNVTILEAENLMGGRVWTVSFGNGLVELGAEYCTGQKGNFVYEVAQHLLEPSEELFAHNVYYSNGTKLDVALMNELVPLIYEFNKQSNETFDSKGKSLEDLFYHRLNSTVVQKYKNDEEKLRIVLKEFPRHAETYIAPTEGAFTWSDISVDKDYQECEGHPMVWKKVGYKTIFDFLLKKHSIEDKLHLNSKVTQINWNQSELVTVYTSDNKSYSADFVIFTPSVGVLKHEKTLFNPPLPSSKQQSIKATGFAGVMKAFVQFRTKWWLDNDTEFSFLWSENDLKNTSFTSGPSKNGIPWVSQLTDFLKVPHNPKVWVWWISGDLIHELEKLPPETMKAGFVYVLDKFLGKNYNVSEIEAIVTPKWYTNEHFRGVYSFTKTGFYEKGFSHQEKLGEPLVGVSGKPAVLFAGEATNRVHYATVHGAIETGFREAGRIIQTL